MDLANIVPSSNTTVIDLTTLLLENVKVPSYQLTQSQINWINQFIASSPDAFVKIANDLKEIASSGKIGIQTIPQLIHLCADVYNNAAVKVGLSHPENILVFIKFTLDTILTSQYLVLPEIEKELVQQMVDTSLNLLILNIQPIIEEVDSVPCFFTLLHFFGLV